MVGVLIAHMVIVCRSQPMSIVQTARGPPPPPVESTQFLSSMVFFSIQLASVPFYSVRSLIVGTLLSPQHHITGRRILINRIAQQQANVQRDHLARRCHRKLNYHPHKQL